MPAAIFNAPELQTYLFFNNVCSSCLLKYIYDVYVYDVSFLTEQGALI
jgi:hypothetical protein